MSDPAYKIDFCIPPCKSPTVRNATKDLDYFVNERLEVIEGMSTAVRGSEIWL